MGASFVKQSSVKMSKYVHIILNTAINLNLITCVLHKQLSFVSVLKTKNQKKMSSKVNQTAMRDRFPSKDPRPRITPSKFHRNHYQINQGNQLIYKDYLNMLWMQHSLRT